MIPQDDTALSGAGVPSDDELRASVAQILTGVARDARAQHHIDLTPDIDAIMLIFARRALTGTTEGAE